MDHYVRALLTISSLTTILLSPRAFADDNGHCLKVFAETSGEMIRKAGVDATSDSAITKVGAAAVATAAARFAVKGQWVGAAVTGAAAAGIYALNYFANGKVDALASDREKYVVEAYGLQRDAALVYFVYSDALAGDAGSVSTTRLMQDLAVDKQNESQVLRHLVDQMEDGTLCEGERPKPLGTITAELKDYERTQLRRIF